MTDLAYDLGPSWLRSLPDGATVRRRDIRECTVTALFDGYFSARAKGERRREYFDTQLVADPDLPLLAVGAKFWQVAEWTGAADVTWAIAFRRPGVATAETAFHSTSPNPQEKQ